MKETKVDVIFRKDKKSGEIIAFLPSFGWNLDYSVTCYEHIGQHGNASLKYYWDCTKPAEPEEYFELMNELKNIYAPEFKLIVKKRMNYDTLEKNAVRL